MKNNRLAIALVGRICSGKTTFTSELMRYGEFLVISKDRCIYESDMLCRKGISKSWEEIREEKIDCLTYENVILDETIRVGKLERLKEKGYTIIAIIMETDSSFLQDRLQKRNQINEQYLERLSEITGVKLLECTQEERRNLWRSSEFRNSIESSKLLEFDTILEKLYLLGSKVLKVEEPNAACFSQIDYIIKSDKLVLKQGMSEMDIVQQCVSYKDYKNGWAKNVKYCIWDVGGVFYHYSIDGLHRWARENSRDKNIERKSINFNSYMKGHISFNELCQQICSIYDINFTKECEDHIAKCLIDGVGPMYEETEKMIKYVKSKGVVNCVLSNALPLLADDGNYPDLIASQNRFYSFVFHCLKPDVEIYKLTQQALGVPFDRMIFIDDKSRNVDAAIDLGIYSILFDRNSIESEIRSIFDA